MNANLEDFIEGETAEDTNSNDTNTSSRSREYSDDINVSVKPHGAPPHKQEKNICPKCMAVSPKDEVFGWRCESDHCNTLKFGGGWYQRRKHEWGREDDFLDSVDWVEVMGNLHDRGIGDEEVWSP